MIGCCTKCGKLYEGSEEDTSAPDATCPECYRKAKAQQKQALPWRCPNHPDASVRHEYQRTVFILNDTAGEPMDSDHHYYCAECGRELAQQEP